MNGEPLLQVEDLVCEYVLPRRRLFAPAPRLRAVAGVAFTIDSGESFGLVGESGCGKSTLARAVVALERPTGGRVLFRGNDLSALTPPALRYLRRDFQIIFQDPYGSLDPRQRIGRIVAEPLHVLEEPLSAGERRRRVAEGLEAVGLRAGDADKYPHEFSGGQRQRIAIARALATRPALIVADEPVSALDVSIQAQILNLLMDLQDTFGLSYLFIGHDLSVVGHLADRVAVMYRGKIVEEGLTGQLFGNPLHPYTRALLAAVPRPDPRRRRDRHSGRPIISGGGVADAAGCSYAPRCPLAQEICRQEAPRLTPRDGARRAACHFG